MSLRAVHAVIAILCGVLLSVQGRINGQLGARLHDGVLAALISFGLGFLLLAVVVPATRAGRRALSRVATAVRTSKLKWWQCLGGVCGAFLVVGQGLTITQLGVAVFTVAVVGGQLVSSLLVDRFGIGPAGPQPLTWTRLLGAGIAVIAVVISVYGEFNANSLWLIGLPALAGVGLAWQSAVNGLVRDAAGNPFVAALINFSVGTVVLVIAGVIDVAGRGLPAGLPGEWWLYTGGSMGIFVITGSVVAVRTLGVLILGMCMVAGQLLGAVLLDVLVPAAGDHLTLASVLGTVITLVAVVVAALPPRRRSERMAP
jgi:transporter family-2 protein